MHNTIVVPLRVSFIEIAKTDYLCLSSVLINNKKNCYYQTQQMWKVYIALLTSGFSFFLFLIKSNKVLSHQ